MVRKGGMKRRERETECKTVTVQEMTKVTGAPLSLQTDGEHVMENSFQWLF